MKKILLATIMVLVGLTGCASVRMQPAALIKSPSPNKALVNFVRPSIFFGDGVGYNIWDGPQFIGTLKAGSLIQHEVAPGKRLFLAQGENWAYSPADLEAGKTYVIKLNIYPGVLSGRLTLGTVKPADKRLPGLMELTPTTASEKDRQEISTTKGAEVQVAVANFESGKVSSAEKVLPGDGH